MAERQTAGQGRLGRHWQSPVGNLYASTIIRPLPGDPPATTLALVTGIALHDATALWARDVDVRLKWPNDLMSGSAKLAGILLQATHGAVVAGFGINLLHHPTDLDRPTTSVAALVGSAPTPVVFAETLAAVFARWLARWRGETFDRIRQAWLDRAHVIGTPLRVADAEGLFEGLTAEGALKLRLAGGESVTVNAGDITLA